jgi:hypothetical protein
LVDHVVKDDVHEEGRSLPGALDVALRNTLNAAEQAAILLIGMMGADSSSWLGWQ